MNRVRNESYICKCIENKIRSWTCSILYDNKQQNGLVVNGHSPDIAERHWEHSYIFNKNGTGMVTWKAQMQNNHRTYSHLVLVDCMEGNVMYLTEGKFVIYQQILAWDERSETIYFLGTKENSPLSRHLYSVDVGGRKDIKCLTCDLKVRYSFYLNCYDCFINFYAY